MKHHYVFVLTCSLLQLLPALSQTTTHRVSSRSAITSTEIEWCTEMIDVGYSLQHEELTAKFCFTNTGDAPLYISVVNSANEELEMDYPSQGIPPGGEGEVVVTYMPKRKGDFKFHITVVHNQTQASILKLKGIVYDK